MRKWSAKVGLLVAGFSIFAEILLILLLFSIPYLGLLIGGYSLAILLPLLVANFVFVSVIPSVWKFFY